MVEKLCAFEQAAKEPPVSPVHEVWLFLKENKKWWLLPIIVVLGLVGLLAFVAGTGVAPLIYTIF